MSIVLINYVRVHEKEYNPSSDAIFISLFKSIYHFLSIETPDSFPRCARPLSSLIYIELADLLLLVLRVKYFFSVRVVIYALHSDNFSYEYCFSSSISC